jgi:hypothetical protein
MSSPPKRTGRTCDAASPTKLDNGDRVSASIPPVNAAIAERWEEEGARLLSMWKMTRDPRHLLAHKRHVLGMKEWLLESEILQ